MEVQSLYRLFCPHMSVKSPYDIDLDELQKKGIRGIILDLDNTIVAWDSYDIGRDMADWLKGVVAKGFKVSIVSNNNHARVSRMAISLGIPFVSRALKPIKRGFRKALAQMGIKPQEAAVIGDQLLTDVFGGNRLGLVTIWVQPLSAREFIFTKVHRRVEKMVVRALQKKGLLK